MKKKLPSWPRKGAGEMPAGASKGWLAFSRSAPMKPKWVPQWFHQGVYFLSLGWAWEPHLGTGRGQPQTSTHKKHVVLLRKTLVFYWPASFQGLLEGSPMHDQTNQIWGQVLDPKWPNKVQNGRSSKTHQKNLFPKDAGELQTMRFHSTELRFIRARARSAHTPKSPPHQHRTAPLLRPILTISGLKPPKCLK